jgi:hypothetical protein
MPDETAKPPRFPYVAAALCVACLGAAGWTWMRYSYAWEMRPTDLLVREQTADSDGPFTIEEDGSYIDVYCDNSRADMFVRMKGTYCLDHSISDIPTILIFDGDIKKGSWNIELVAPPPRRPSHSSRVALKGRLLLRNRYNFTVLVFDPTSSRLHGASIAGLVVGAMGVFVFAAALRHWLNRRRAFHVETAEVDT